MGPNSLYLGANLALLLRQWPSEVSMLPHVWRSFHLDWWKTQGFTALYEFWKCFVYYFLMVLFFFLGSLLIYMYKSILSQRPKDSLFNSCELPLSFCVDSYFLVFCPINFSCLGFTESLSSQLRKTNRGLFGFYPSRLQPGNSFKAVNWNTWMVYFISFLSGSLTCAACCLVSENLFHIFDCLIV